MENATDILRKEHKGILKMLDVSEEVARRLEAGQQVVPEVLASLGEFFRLFADRCHHGKEEDLLFLRLQEKGMPRAGGPIGVMLAEHDQGRALVREMADAAATYEAGKTEVARQWVGAARGYTALLRSHIDKENNVLFMMAERMLTPAEQNELAEAFERLEVEKMGAGTHERLHGVMDRLAAEFLAKK